MPSIRIRPHTYPGAAGVPADYTIEFWIADGDASAALIITTGEVPFPFVDHLVNTHTWTVEVLPATDEEPAPLVGTLMAAFDARDTRIAALEQEITRLRTRLAMYEAGGQP